jgi:hypothetical protein
MKRILLTFLLAMVFVCTLAQVKLQTSNPAPRVGDAMTISFVLEKPPLDSKKSQNDVITILASGMNRIADGSLKMNEGFLTDIGPLKLGPFQFQLNGRVFNTNELNITVSPKLPDNIDEGIWIRQVEFQGQKWIILEQRSPGEMKPVSGASGSVSYTISTEDVQWSRLAEEKFRKNGVDLHEENSSVTIQPVSNGSALYKITVFTYQTLPSFKGELIIDKKLLLYAPEKGHFEGTKIKS